MKLAELIRQTSFVSPAHKAVLNVLATESWLRSRIARTLEPHGITPTQYNVLRILRGGHPQPYTCSDIGERLLDRTPDVTRLLGRLEREGLIARRRADADRRVVEVSITEKGLALLASLDAPMDECIAQLTHHLSEGDQHALSDLLDTLRTDQT